IRALVLWDVNLLLSAFFLSSPSKFVLPYFFQPPPTVTMLFKSLALAAAFAAFSPTLAAPVSDDALPVRRQLADVGVIVDNILNNATISILSSRGPVRRQLADVGVVVDNILNNATISVLSSRGEDACSVREITRSVTDLLEGRDINTASPSKRGGCNPIAIRDETYHILSKLYIRDLSPTAFKRGYEGCSLADVTAVVKDVGNNAQVTVAKRDDCDLIGLKVIVQNVLENLKINILAPSTKRSTPTLADIALAIFNVLNNLKINVASLSKRGQEVTLADITAIVTNVLSNLHIDVASS
ncbi:hypothetical protein AZE42_05089, partial [Rhizopogon vesiculosus]